MFIRSIGISLPKEKVTIRQPELSKYDHFEDEPEISFYRASAKDSPFSFAKDALDKALANAGLTGDSLSAVIYADSLIKDYAQWSLSAALCEKLGLHGTMFMDIYQACNFLAVVELVIDLLKARPEMKRVVVVTSRVLPSLLGDHSSIEKGAFLSDGGGALIIDKERGDYEILSVATNYNSRLAHFIKLSYGGTEALKKSDRVELWDIRKCKERFWDGREPTYDEDFFSIKNENRKTVLAKALLKSSDVSWTIFPNYCRFYNEDGLKAFPCIDIDKTSVKIGMRFSHMGATDVIVNLHNMSPLIKAKDIVLMNQDGAGHSFTSMLLRKV